MKNIISWSGGKDSTATVILAHEHNIPIDEIVFVEVMYDNKRNISGENPAHIDFIYNVAKPKFEEWGYKVTILRDKDDYLTLYNHIIGNKTTHKERIGKKQGFLFGGGCWGNSRLKMRPLTKFKKELGKHNDYVGIAIDEPKRLERLKVKQNTYSLLAEYNLTEKDALMLCKQYGLLSPIYADYMRGGCWFCPNATIKERCAFRKDNPNLWQELIDLDTNNYKELAHHSFAYGKTIQEVTLEMDKYDREQETLKNQYSIFDL